MFLFFFQAEDGIRDFHVTGVQTCALPISLSAPGNSAALVDVEQSPTTLVGELPVSLTREIVDNANSFQSPNPADEPLPPSTSGEQTRHRETQRTRRRAARSAATAIHQRHHPHRAPGVPRRRRATTDELQRPRRRALRRTSAALDERTTLVDVEPPENSSALVDGVSGKGK